MQNKKYLWSFMGQVKKRPTRQSMLIYLKKLDGDFFENSNESWQSSDKIGTKEYRKILEESVFAPCPRGNESVDSFRLYESIEAGAIPIPERGDNYWDNIFQNNHPFIMQANKDWSNIPKWIEYFMSNENALDKYRENIQLWWSKYKKNLNKSIKNIFSSHINSRDKEKIHDVCFCCDENLINYIINPINALSQKNNTSIGRDLKTKQQQFIELKNQWANFKDYKFLNYISELIPKEYSPKENCSMYNPGKNIAVVSLYTEEISEYAIHSENSIKEYCKKQNYTFYVYRRKIDQDSSPNWSKAQALLNHVNDHDYLIWMDSDTLVFNPEKKFEDIISKASRKFIIATKDIGENSMLNSGVLIFKCHNYTKNLIKKWRDFDGDKSSLYASGGDQEILCEILKKSDPFGYNRKIFEMNEFNTDPRFVDKDTFILHFMAYPHKLKKIFMSYWQNNFSTESL